MHSIPGYLIPLSYYKAEAMAKACGGIVLPHKKGYVVYIPHIDQWIGESSYVSK
jgi:hypothetical protein